MISYKYCYQMHQYMYIKILVSFHLTKQGSKWVVSYCHGWKYINLGKIKRTFGTNQSLHFRVFIFSNLFEVAIYPHQSFNEPKDL